MWYILASPFVTGEIMHKNRDTVMKNIQASPNNIRLLSLKIEFFILLIKCLNSGLYKGLLFFNQIKVMTIKPIIFKIKNGIGLTKAFSNKEEALSYVEEINNKYFEMAELK